jgi:hypothetical protein
MKKIEKDPLFKLDYKKQSAIMNAKTIREKAMIESKELKELERIKMMEKRDMFMSREHELKKRKQIVGYRAAKAKQILMDV